MVSTKILEAIRGASKEFELIIKITSIVAEYLGAEKVNFLVKANGTPIGLGSGNCVPIEVIDDKTISAWQIVNGPAALSPEQIFHLQLIGCVLVLALENIALRQQVIVDSLTKLYNRAYFDIRLKEEVEATKRYGMPFSLLMLDIDRFKSFNDTYGHQAGDEVLRIVAKVLRDNTRASDLVFRYGGEEFIVFLQNINEENALKVAERLKKHIDETVNTADRLREIVKRHPFVQDGKSVPISISIGISAYSGLNKDLTLADIVKKADESLFRAKQMGRDRIEVMGRNEMLRLLIVDDDAEYTRFLADYFTNRGFSVMTALSGKDALELLGRHEFDLMFLDLRMPGITGIDVLQRIPTIMKKMRVLILTAIGDEDVKRVTSEYGACEYLQKPISIEYLNKQLMARILEMRA